MSFSGTKGYITKPKPGVMLNPLHPLSRGLVGYWLFNEGSGSRANDISGHGNHGTLKNMLPNIQGSGWSGSKFGGGLQFDRSNDYINCGDDNSVSPNYITISALVKLDFVASVSMRIVSKWWDGSSRSYDLYIVSGAATSTATFVISVDGNNPPNTANASFTAYNGFWTLITATYDGSIQRLYFNDVEVDTYSQSGTIHQNNADLIIGAQPRDASPTGTLQDYWSGCQEFVMKWNRALSAKEVKQLYHNPFCNLLQVPIRRYSVIAAPPVGAIMNQFQGINLGADLYNGVFA